LSQALQTKTKRNHQYDGLHDEDSPSINALHCQNHVDHEDYRQNFNPKIWERDKNKQPPMNALIFRICRMKCPYGYHDRDAKQSVNPSTPHPNARRIWIHAVSQSNPDPSAFATTKCPVWARAAHPPAGGRGDGRATAGAWPLASCGGCPRPRRSPSHEVLTKAEFLVAGLGV
jgi:hypothetical protein